LVAGVFAMVRNPLRVAVDRGRKTGRSSRPA
jgi:hypothetical protein